MGDVFKPGMLENFYLVAGMQAVAMKPWFLVDVDVQAERWVAVHLRWDVNGMLTDVNGIRLDG